MSRLPALFVTHGAPTLPLEPGPTGPFLRDLAGDVPRPDAILCVSAHWETAAPAIGAADPPPTIHDFYGFPEPLYRLRYPAPGAPDLAARAAEALAGAGIACAADRERGLDHGAWVPLMLMYPDADLPVAQLAIQPGLGPAHHLAMGRALAPLRDAGVLILASGSATHSLRDFGRYAYDDPAPGWVAAFDDWLVAAVTEGRTDDLVAWRDRAPENARNHPTDDHYLPLLVAAGAAGDGMGHGGAGRLLHRATTYGIIRMTAFAFD